MRPYWVDDEHFDTWRIPPDYVPDAIIRDGATVNGLVPTTRLLANGAPGSGAVGVDVSPAMIAKADELHDWTYRARYEKGFTRYTWLDAGDGANGYWLAELPETVQALFFGGISLPAS